MEMRWARRGPAELSQYYQQEYCAESTRFVVCSKSDKSTAAAACFCCIITGGHELDSGCRVCHAMDTAHNTRQECGVFSLPFYHFKAQCSFSYP